MLLRLNARNCFPGLNNRIALTAHGCAIVTHTWLGRYHTGGAFVLPRRERERTFPRLAVHRRAPLIYFVPLFINIL